jgi:anti-sigma factor RsiW
VKRDSQSMAKETHEYCWNVLPWFVTGRLSGEDMQRVERHLEHCDACRAELAEQRELCMHIRREESVLLAPQASLQKMMARIDASTSTDQVPDLVDFPAAASGTPPPVRPHRTHRWLAIAAALQTVTIAFLLALVLRQTTQEMTAPRFTTLTTPSTANESGASLRVVFKPDTQAAAMQSLLRAVSAQVIAGPTEAGVYTLRLASEATERDVARALSQMREDDAVIFAERVSLENRP